MLVNYLSIIFCFYFTQQLLLLNLMALLHAEQFFNWEKEKFFEDAI